MLDELREMLVNSGMGEPSDMDCVCCGTPLGGHSAIAYCDWCNTDSCWYVDYRDCREVSHHEEVTNGS